MMDTNTLSWWTQAYFESYAANLLAWHSQKQYDESVLKQIEDFVPNLLVVENIFPEIRSNFRKNIADAILKISDAKRIDRCPKLKKAIHTFVLSSLHTTPPRSIDDDWYGA